MLEKISLSALTEDRQKKISVLIIIGMLFLLVWAIFFVVAEVYQDIFILKTKKNISSFSIMDTASLSDLSSTHLFGDASNLPITSLQLRLLGVIKSDSDENSKVIISEANQPGKVYSKGKMLPSGVIVYDISNEGVILKNNGRFEKLPLARSPLLFQDAPRAMEMP